MNLEQLAEALAHMESALQLLDDADASADIGAHLDLAIWRLRESMSTETSKAGGAGRPPMQGN